MLFTKNGVINQRTVSDVILKTTMDKNRANGDIFCCFCWCSTDCPPHKYSRFMVKGHTPAILQRKTRNNTQKKGPKHRSKWITFKVWSLLSSCIKIFKVSGKGSKMYKPTREHRKMFSPPVMYSTWELSVSFLHLHFAITDFSPRSLELKSNS